VNVRLFIAIELNEAVSLALARFQDMLKRRCDGIRWVRDDQLHLTIKLLGDVPDKEIDQVTHAMTIAVHHAQPFCMTIESSGCFPRSGAPRVVWAGVTETTHTLARCKDTVEAELADAGFPQSHGIFSPHITLGRIKRDAWADRIRKTIEAADYATLSQPVDKLVLKSSVLSPQGPTYRTVASAALSKL